MEKIKINSIEMKGPNKTICVVKYMPNGGASKILLEAEATLNTKWQSQEVDYLQNDVGLNGEVSVLIEQKGQYTNITKVDFDSAVPSGQILKEVQNGVRSLNGQEQKSMAEEKFRTPKEMVATELVKAVLGTKCENVEGYMLKVKLAVDMYKEALELLG